MKGHKTKVVVKLLLYPNIYIWHNISRFYLKEGCSYGMLNGYKTFLVITCKITLNCLNWTVQLLSCSAQPIISIYPLERHHYQIHDFAVRVFQILGTTNPFSNCTLPGKNHPAFVVHSVVSLSTRDCREAGNGNSYLPGFYLSFRFTYVNNIVMMKDQPD